MLRCLGLILWLGLAGCSSMQLAWDCDAQAVFPALHSYDWLPAPGVESGAAQMHYNGLLESRVRDAVDAQLRKKGFRRDTGSPDFLVACHVAVDERLSVTYLNELYGYGPGWGNPRYMRSYGRLGREATVSNYPGRNADSGRGADAGPASGLAWFGERRGIPRPESRGPG